MRCWWDWLKRLAWTALEYGQHWQAGEFADAVEADIEHAQRLDITGVAFFEFNGKYGVSGAQPVEAFLEVLHRTWAELPDRAVITIP